MDRNKARKRAEELVSKMTVEEAASQLRFDAPAIERLGVPEYNWWNEALHGVARAGTATSFPQSIALGATFDQELLGKIGETIATEGRAKYNEISANMGDRDIYKGLTFWSPNVNVFRDPRWGRGQETYGEDPYLISRLAIPFIKGLQGDGEYMKAAACAKHFVVHSGPEAKRHEFDVEPSKKDLRETYLPAFEACVKEAGVESVMGAYNRVNGEPCCGHSFIKDIIRDEWGFEGHFVSDCWAIRDFHENHKVTKNSEESAALALSKGCDLNCGCTYVHLMKAYNKGLITEAQIRESAVRLFTTRFLLGLFDETEYDGLTYLDVETEDNIALAKRASDEAIVLLKNDGILPLNGDKKVISVIGPNADARRPLMGNYYGTSSEYITAIEGIRKAAGDNVRILYSEGCDLSIPKPDPLSRDYNTIAEAKAVMSRSDLVILCIGLNETLEGEEGDQGNQYASGDKNNLSFPKPQLKLIEAVKNSGKPFIVVVMTGSAMDLTPFSEEASAILQAWYPGARGGLSIGDIIFGKVNPSGKLPVTICRSVEDLPDFEDYSMKNRTYKYTEHEPLYPFGYGLTYGKVTIENISVSDSSAQARENGFDITVNVKNEGGIKTGEVIQIYAKALEDKNEVRNFKLVGFKRILLEEGQSGAVVLHINPDSLKVFDDEGNKVIPEGKIRIYAGFGQPDDRTSQLYQASALELTI